MSLEVWGGIECTVNRVHDEFFDQLNRNGHAEPMRISDLDDFAKLGLKCLRYPVLWEKTAPESLDDCDWTWPDERLSRLRELQLNPIVGLLHHGSGPKYTSLIDPEFPEKLAQYAKQVAERYPWVELWTPVNEPLTTARFSGLYGLWYPHGKDESTFLKALLNQVKATVLAMREIKKINPLAKLVQTEDLGKVHSTSKLAYQANFENERRWLSFDLLCGRVNEKHSLWSFILKHGIVLEELKWFEENFYEPDIFGANYYITSERFLDENLNEYPSCTHGGNGIDQYADVEAVRCMEDGHFGFKGVVTDLWERYHKTIAITEAHIGCTREEQMRWFLDIWNTSEALIHEGVDIQAVTAWSLLGAYDWNSLLTCNHGHYEPGVFDMRCGYPRPTALSNMLRTLADRSKDFHFCMKGTGWWQRPERLLYRKKHHTNAQSNQNNNYYSEQRPLLITGGRGTLGQAFARICEMRGLKYILLSRQDADITDKNSVLKIIETQKPWGIINTAGYVKVDQAEKEQHACYLGNTQGAVNLAEACAEFNLTYLTFSSDLVFDGKKSTPYLETDKGNPLNVYGKSKLQAEEQVLKIYPEALMIRTSAFFGPWDQYNFLYYLFNDIKSGKVFKAAEDNSISPTYVPDLINESLNLLIDGEKGIWHLANQGEVSWYEFAQLALEIAEMNSPLLQPVKASEVGWLASRPKYSVLGSKRGHLLPKLENALERFITEAQFICEHNSREKLSISS